MTNANSLMVLTPYLHQGLWVFDDESTQLVREPFVMGIDTMISEMVAKNHIVDAEKGFNLIFSATPFPGADVELELVRPDCGGNWYKSEMFEYEGWLCPALFKYFDDAPQKLYAQFKQINHS